VSASSCNSGGVTARGVWISNPWGNSEYIVEGIWVNKDITPNDTEERGKKVEEGAMGVSKKRRSPRDGHGERASNGREVSRSGKGHGSRG